MFTTLDELTYIRGETYITFDIRTRAWLHLIRGSTNVFYKQLGGKHKGKPNYTWFDSKCEEAWQNYHVVLNLWSYFKNDQSLTMHSLDNTSKITFKQYRTMIKLKKYSYIERKQKELHLLLKNDQILFGMSFEEKKTTRPCN